MLTGPRVMLRRFQHADVAKFVAYRSDPQVARFQSWDAPYPRDAVTDPPGVAPEIHEFCTSGEQPSEFLRPARYPERDGQGDQLGTFDTDGVQVRGPRGGGSLGRRSV